MGCFAPQDLQDRRRRSNLSVLEQILGRKGVPDFYVRVADDIVNHVIEPRVVAKGSKLNRVERPPRETCFGSCPVRSRNAV